MRVGLGVVSEDLLRAVLDRLDLVRLEILRLRAALLPEEELDEEERELEEARREIKEGHGINLEELPAYLCLKLGRVKIFGDES